MYILQWNLISELRAAYITGAVFSVLYEQLCLSLTILQGRDTAFLSFYRKEN